MVYPGTKLIIPDGPLPTYTVRNGDFLNGIAKAAGIRLRDLLALNGLQKESLVLPGDVLRLPRGATVPTPPAATTTTAPPQPAKQTPAPVPSASAMTYTVKNGDWLIGIAMAHGIKVRELIAVNDMQLDSLVYEGLVLRLPANAKAPAVAPTPVKQPDPAPAPTTTTTTTTTTPTSSAPTPEPSADVLTVIEFLKAQVGKPYKFFSAGPDAYDCSGLSKAAYALVGIQLTHYSGSQAKSGEAVDWTTQPILAGDLVFTASASTPGVIGHLGIAIDGKRWIHAPRAGESVRVGMIPSDAKILAVRRLIPAG
jgi:peptidoglycan endopeptidase LytE